ncbi:hypothetical protein vseg_008740 [Gypsophila vaccaria]
MKLPLVLFYIFCRSMLFLSFIHGASAHIVPIVVTNKCHFPIWPATASNTGHSVIANGGFYLAPAQTTVIHAPWDWSGRVWARTGCNFNPTSNHTQNWQLACLTGDCDGRLECNGLIGTPPATLVEITLQTDKNQPSFFDVSLVDGYNLPISVSARRSGSTNCSIKGCLRDLNTKCPLELQIKDCKGNVVACKSACLAYNLDRFCCRNEYDSPEKCTPSLYSNVFKDTCPCYVSYAYDSPTPLVSCLVNELDITFCPGKWGDAPIDYA